MDNNELYYLQDSRNYSGNDLLWWGKNGAGYVTDLRKAQTFTRLEALQQNTARETDIPWPKNYADVHIKYAVDSQDVSLSAALEGKISLSANPTKIAIFPRVTSARTAAASLLRLSITPGLTTVEPVPVARGTANESPCRIHREAPPDAFHAS